MMSQLSRRYRRRIAPARSTSHIHTSHTRCYLIALMLALIFPLMLFGLLNNHRSGTTAARVTGVSAADTTSISALTMEDRLRGALWGFFAGDALAAPTHWYYGGVGQIKADYGSRGITDYTKPMTKLSGSILNKSNINGGGRGSFRNPPEGISIIGDVINHGKRELWDPNKQIHYHATLQAGENTLEAQLARVLMKSIVAKRGKFDADHFRDAYIKFMTTPGSHNDTYASTCHRMFFANLKLRNLDPKDCPDNDMHNVDTIDGLVLPTITALAMTAKGESSDAVSQSCAATAAVTRRSSVLDQVSRAWSSVVSAAVKGTVSNEELISEYLPACAKAIGLSRKPNPRTADQMTACNLQQSFPPTLDSLAKYVPENEIWKGLLANANVGGENVHRGSLLGAVLGARSGLPNVPDHLRTGLYDKSKLSAEIDNFVEAVLS